MKEEKEYTLWKKGPDHIDYKNKEHTACVYPLCRAHRAGDAGRAEKKREDPLRVKKAGKAAPFAATQADIDDALVRNLM